MPAPTVEAGFFVPGFVWLRNGSRFPSLAPDQIGGLSQFLGAIEDVMLFDDAG